MQKVNIEVNELINSCCNGMKGGSEKNLLFNDMFIIKETRRRIY